MESNLGYGRKSSCKLLFFGAYFPSIDSIAIPPLNLCPDEPLVGVSFVRQAEHEAKPCRASEPISVTRGPCPCVPTSRQAGHRTRFGLIQSGSVPRKTRRGPSSRICNVVIRRPRYRVA